MMPTGVELRFNCSVSVDEILRNRCIYGATKYATVHDVLKARRTVKPYRHVFMQVGQRKECAK